MDQREMESEHESLCELIVDPRTPLYAAAQAYALSVARQRACLRDARAIDAKELTEAQRAEFAEIVAALTRTADRYDAAWAERWTLEEASGGANAAYNDLLETMSALVSGRG